MQFVAYIANENIEQDVKVEGVMIMCHLYVFSLTIKIRQSWQ